MQRGSFESHGPHMRKVDPDKFIVPLAGYREEDPTPDFLGTGFFVHSAPTPLLVTANHVIGDLERVGIYVYRRSVFHEAEIIAQDSEVDLALLRVPDYHPEKPLQIAPDNQLLTNQLVNCFEYSGTSFLEEDGGTTAALSTSSWLGNITSFVDLTDQYKGAGDQMLVLSFAALKGASGAPVVSNANLDLWGIVTANRASDLLPTQIETTFDEKNQPIEEVKFMLPQALAVHVKHLRSILDQHGSPE